MKTECNVISAIALTFAAFLQTEPVLAQIPAADVNQEPRGLSVLARDPRVQNRTYHFAETDEDLPYAVFVSSKVSKDTKAPLIIALHGMNGTPETFLRGAAIDQAEEGGYILVGPMGYNSVGSFGMSMSFGGRGTAPATASQTQPAAPSTDNQPATQTSRTTGRAMGMGIPTVGGTAETDQTRVTEYSEKDAMYVLEMIRKEFNIDENRIYLMGHSLGGGGALHLGEKYASIWAAIAAIAPASFGFQPDDRSGIRDIPIIIVQGDADELVRPAMSDRLAEQLEELHMTYEYKTIPGADHSTIIMESMPDVYAFFDKHAKSE